MWQQRYWTLRLQLSSRRVTHHHHHTTLPHYNSTLLIRKQLDSQKQEYTFPVQEINSTEHTHSVGYQYPMNPFVYHHHHVPFQQSINSHQVEGSQNSQFSASSTTEKKQSTTAKHRHIQPSCRVWARSNSKKLKPKFQFDLAFSPHHHRHHRHAYCIVCSLTTKNRKLSTRRKKYPQDDSKSHIIHKDTHTRLTSQNSKSTDSVSHSVAIDVVWRVIKKPFDLKENVSHKSATILFLKKHLIFFKKENLSSNKHFLPTTWIIVFLRRIKLENKFINLIFKRKTVQIIVFFLVWNQNHQHGLLYLFIKNTKSVIFKVNILCAFIFFPDESSVVRILIKQTILKVLRFFFISQQQQNKAKRIIDKLKPRKKKFQIRNQTKRKYLSTLKTSLPTRNTPYETSISLSRPKAKGKTPP